MDSESHTAHGIRSYSRMLQSRSIIRPGLRRGAQIRRRSVCRLEYHRGRIRFLKEAQDVARFQSEPNIVSIYDYLEENDTAYMVMEYLHG